MKEREREGKRERERKTERRKRKEGRWYITCAGMKRPLPCCLRLLGNMQLKKKQSLNICLEEQQSYNDILVIE